MQSSISSIVREFGETLVLSRRDRAALVQFFELCVDILSEDFDQLDQDKQNRLLNLRDNKWGVNPNDPKTIPPCPLLPEVGSPQPEEMVAAILDFTDFADRPQDEPLLLPSDRTLISPTGDTEWNTRLGFVLDALKDDGEERALWHVHLCLKMWSFKIVLAHPPEPKDIEDYRDYWGCGDVLRLVNRDPEKYADFSKRLERFANKTIKAIDLIDEFTSAPGNPYGMECAATFMNGLLSFFSANGPMTARNNLPVAV